MVRSLKVLDKYFKDKNLVFIKPIYFILNLANVFLVFFNTN